ncbi:ankyrin repeat domain-containing protein [Parachlamydia sp. AcF125]|uniref:ankyrin repeat domain-containing protein n=1 Tax=Parachlamydia sp. AcF125 TaxID=2795736 RepID=UPI001BC8E31C|nr:ankyrin repeat domain-containing protein [Parachlamydia sp. AcF125]MBS4169054.1 Phosphocholine transferase AnkX [Parachlamydia sp. AcF125]
MNIHVSFLLKADRIADYVPGLSTITNLIDLFQKYVMLPTKQKANISNNHYYSYLKQKSFSRCIVLLVPVIGNISVAIYDFAKGKYNHKEVAPTAVQPVPPFTSPCPQNYNPHKPVAKGLAKDKGRQLGKYAKSLVIGGKEAKVSKAVQQEYSQATCEHRFTVSFMALYPHLSTQLGPVHPQAIAKNTQLVGANSQLHIQASSVIHYHETHSSRLPEAKLHEKLKDLLQLNCPGCIKDLMAQGHKFLKEVEEEAALRGVFYLATAYELYVSLKLQEYSFERQAFDKYLDKLERGLGDEQTLLHYFAAHENRSIFIYLFAERQNIESHLNALGGRIVKETPLHVASRAGSMPIVQFLLEQGADLKKLDSLQNNVLHHACCSQKDRVDIVKLLMQYEPTFIKAKNSDDQTPLHLAAFSGNAKSMEHLLNQIEGPIELDQQDKKGNTPLHLAVIGVGRSSSQAAEDYIKIVIALVKKGANLNALNPEKKTVLALIFKNEAITQALIQASLSSQIMDSFLRSYYLSQETLSIFRIKAQKDWEFKVPLEEIYVRLGMIENEERKTRDQALGKHSEYLQGASMPAYETMFESKEEIEIEQLFEHESLNKEKAKRIYIQGVAGIGKSTLCHYIRYRWAKGTLWAGMFTCLFWIPLRNLTLRKYPADKEYTPAGLIAKEYAGKIESKVIEACIQDTAFLQNTLLVLDGYDELPAEAQANTSLATAFKQLKELFPHILITSRPGSCSFKRSCELELLGFDNEGIEDYIERFFKHLEAEEKKEKLYHLLNSSPQVLSLAQIPINLTLLCCLFNEDPEVFDARQPITMTYIYERMVNWMYKWFLLRRIDQGQSRQTKEEILAEKNLRQNLEVANIANAFEKMASFAMRNDTLYLSKREIENFKGNKILSNELTDCGLMRIPGAVTEEKGYFIHLTFQEFLTASKVANQYLTGERQACQDFVRTYKFEPRYALVLRMIAGYLSLSTSNNRFYLDPNPLQAFFDDLFAEPYDLAVGNEIDLIAECFEECQDPTTVKQYEAFIELVKDYIAHLSLLDLNFAYLLKNKKIFTHSSITALIERLLSAPHTRARTLINLREAIRAGQRLAPGIVRVIIEVLKNPHNAKDATSEYAWSVLEAVIEQGDGLPKKEIDALIQILKEEDYRVKESAAGFLRALAEQGSKFPEEILDVLIQILKKGGSYAKWCAAGVLEALAEQAGQLPEGVLDALIQILKEGDFNAECCAACFLRAPAHEESKLSEEVLGALIQILKEGDFAAKCSAAGVLEILAQQGGKFPKMVPKEALDALIQILKEGDSKAKHCAVSVLRALAKQRNKFPEEVLNALIQILKEGDSKAKHCAVSVLRALAKQRNKFPEEVLDALIQILKEGDSTAKCSAVGVLGALVQQAGQLPEEVLGVLIQILQEGDFTAKIYAASFLEALAREGNKFPEEVLDALIQILKEGDSTAKCSAVGVLGALVQQAGQLPEEVLGVLIQVLQKGDFNAKTYAASILEALVQQAGQLPEEVLGVLIQILQEGDFTAKTYAASILGALAREGNKFPEEVLDALIQILQEGDSDTKCSAAGVLEALVKQGNKFPEEVLDALIQILKEGDSAAKCSAAGVLEALVKQGNKFPEEVLDAFIQTLKEGDYAAKCCAASILKALAREGNKFSEEALGALIQTLKEGDSAAKCYAAGVLEALAQQAGQLPEGVLDALIQILKEKEGDSAAKCCAADFLGKIAQQESKLPEEALSALIQVLQKGDFNAKHSAAGVLEALAQQENKLPEEVLGALVQVLQKGDPAAKPLAIRVLKGINKNALLKMSREALSLIVEICFFNKYSFSVKGQQFQISDRRTTCLSKHTLELSYEEIREKLPSEIGVWRERLSTLSFAKDSQESIDRAQSKRPLV